MRLLVSIFVAVVLSLGLSANVAAEKQVILVLDASGSMWGQMSGKPKIQIAREVVDSMLKDWDANNSIGLVTYGHRKKGDCKDIETLIPVGKLDAGKFQKAVAGLNPKGKTPLTEAVKQAAKTLKYTESAATVILISDGKETCNADPCAVAAELEKSGVDFTAHVIGFDVTEKEGISQLQCMAKNTGGEFLAANDASSLKTALKTAVKKVEAAPAPQVDPNAPVNVHLYTVLKAGGKPVGGSWFRVYVEEKDAVGQTKRKEVKTNGYYSEVKFKLNPGSYIATAKNGQASVEMPIVVKAGEALSQEMNLNAGKLKTIAYMGAGGKPEPGNWFRVYREDKDEFGKPKRVEVATNGYYAETVFTIPAGSYIATAKKGSASGEQVVEIKPGEGATADIILNAGRVKLTSFLSQGGKPAGGSWFRVYREDKDEFGKPKRVEVATNGYYAEVEFTIPAGSFIATAKKGSASVEQTFSVEAGKAKAVDLIYNAGQLKLISVAKAGGKPVGGSWFRVYREEKDEFGKSKEVEIATNGYYGEVVFVVPAGEYIARAENKGKKVSAKVKVEAGKETITELVFEEMKK